MGAQLEFEAKQIEKYGDENYGHPAENVGCAGIILLLSAAGSETVSIFLIYNTSNADVLALGISGVGLLLGTAGLWLFNRSRAHSRILTQTLNTAISFENKSDALKPKIAELRSAGK